MAVSFARRRLLRDYAEVQKEPSSLVSAAPLDDNLFEWPANSRPNQGPLAGITIHVRIVFPIDHPDSPPMLHFPMKEIPSFVHPNLYGFGLCLDILTSYIGSTDHRAGWSPAYTVRTLLMQLQSFLFEFDAAPQDHGGSYRFSYDSGRIARVRTEASRLRCSTCGHCARSFVPALLPESRVVVCPNTLPAGMKELNAQLSQKMASLAQVRCAPLACEEGSNGTVLRAGDELVHLRTTSQTELTVRVISMGKNGGLRIGTGMNSCGGLIGSRGCVAWDLAGKLVLGRQVHDRALPTATIGDEVSVQLVDTSIAFSLNGQQAIHEAKLWPQKPLRFFLRGPHDAEVSDEHTSAWLSFRNASVEVLGTVLEDWGTLVAASDAAHLEGDIKSLEIRRDQLVRQLREGRDNARKMRDLQATQGTWSNQLPGDLLLAAFVGADSNDVPAVMNVCTSWRELAVERGLLDRLQLNCFYTKSSPAQDVLGFGIKATYHGDGNLKAVESELDVLSASAFSEFNLRRGAWGAEFEHFLPLVLDDHHMARALPFLERSLANIATAGSRHGAAAPVPKFEAWMALAVLPQLMNSFAVSLMDASGKVTRHVSEKALRGYCSFHHMLLALASKHPSISQVATRKIRNFLVNRNARHKSETPDLGQLIVYCAIADVHWQDVAQAVIEEANVRRVLWLLRASPQLESPKIGDEALLRGCFEGGLTGLRLLMFQAFFLCNIARPAHEALDDALPRYSRQFGLPTEHQVEELFQAARGILAVSSWSGFFHHVGLKAPNSQQLVASNLREAIFASACAGYHTPSAKFGRRTPMGKGSSVAKALMGSVPHRVRPPMGLGERVGVQSDLRRAFATLPSSTMPQSKMLPSKAHTLQTKPEPFVLKNRFAAFED